MADERRVEVSVVGAGIIGLSCAWHLAGELKGAIAILDGAGVGSGATAIQPGGVRQQWASELTCRIARESYLFYRQVDDHLQPAVPPSLDPCGYLFLAESEHQLAQLRERVAIQNAAGVPSELIDPAQALEVAPGLDVSTLLGASFCSEDGYFDRPQAVVAAFASEAQRAGVELVPEFVRRIERNGGGWRLELADGSHVLSEHVVVAAAQASTSLLAPLGVELPITPEPRYIFYSDPLSTRLLEPLVVAVDRHFAAKQLADGSVLASDLRASGEPETERPSWMHHIREAISALVPILEYVSFPVLVEGTYDVTPDAQPIVGAIESEQGLWVAAGMNGRGFMLAPALGRFLAERISGRDAADPIARLGPSRFERGELIPEGQVV